MKKIILFLSFFVFSVSNFAQTVVKTSIDEFDNVVITENSIEMTKFMLDGCKCLFIANTGKVGFFESKYKIALPSSSKTGELSDYDLYGNMLYIDDKNLKKIYSSIENTKDVKISSARVYATNDFVKSASRVQLDIKYKIFEDGETLMYINQTSVYDEHPVLNENWIFNKENTTTLKNVISKYI